MAERSRPTLADIFDVLRSPHLSEHEKVLWGLYRAYDRGEGAWPGDETLQAHMGTPEKPKSLRAVRSYRSSLLAKGYLECDRRGPHPAVYRAVVPRESPARSCPPSPAKDRQDPAAVRRPSIDIERQDSAAVERQDSAALDEDRQDLASQAPEERQEVAAQRHAEPEDRQQDRQKDRQDLAASPTPPIAEEYGEYGKTADDVAESRESDSPGRHSSGVDGVREFTRRHPEAAEALRKLTHPGGTHATAAALRMRFLYVNGEGMPDPSVKGLDLERRIELVAAAIIEGASQGWDRWAPRALAGFVRRLRNAPDPNGDHPGMSAAEEQEREEARRETARARVTSEARLQEVQTSADAKWRAEQDALDWLDTQDPETKARAKLSAKTKLRARYGYQGDVDQAPSLYRRSVYVEVAGDLQAEKAGATP